MKLILVSVLTCIQVCALFGQKRLYYYTGDSLRVCRNIQGERDKDQSTFLKNAGIYSRKTDGLYYMSERIRDVDLNSLIVFENSLGTWEAGGNITFCKDNRSVYYLGERIKKAHSRSFELVRGDYAKDRNYVYIGKRIIKKADPATFEYINREYTKDASYFYSYGFKLKGNEAVHLERLYKYYPSLDLRIVYTAGDNEVFYKGEKLDCDVSSFRDLEDGYAKDTNHAYYNGEIITGADAASFSRTNNPEDIDLYLFLRLNVIYLDSPFAKDKDHSYFFGKLIK